MNINFRKFSIAVVIPAYHVADEIEDVIRSLPDYLRHIIVVDDASPDNTSELVRLSQTVTGVSSWCDTSRIKAWAERC